MYWYHIAGICGHHKELKYSQHLIHDPGDNLEEAKTEAKKIITLCKNLDYALRVCPEEVANVSSEIDDIKSFAEDISNIENTAVNNAVGQFNAVSDLCKDQFHAGLRALSEVRSLHDQLKEYQLSLPKELQKGLGGIVNQVNKIDSGLIDVFLHGTNLTSLLRHSGWSEQAVERVLSFFPLETRYNAKYLFCEHEESQSQGNLRFRSEKDGTVLWCNGERVGIECGFQRVWLDSKGNLWLTTDSSRDKLVWFDLKDLSPFFENPLEPKPHEIDLYRMINSEAHNLSAINFCRGALEVY